MFITKMSLPRRSFLRGMGVTLALPLLESMVPAMTAMARTAAAPNPTRRFGAIFVPLGERPGFWTPKTVGENFDAVGAWRTRDGGTLGSPINASGELLDGTKVDGVVTLRQALVRNPEIFVGTVTEKLMTYALGRGLAYYDMPAVRAIVQGSAAHDYRFSAIVQGIVNSTPFQKRIKVTQDIENPAVRAAAR